MPMFRRPSPFPVTDVFIETGTNLGHSLAAAVAAGYSECLSVEFVEDLYLAAVTRFGRDPRVRLFRGSSPDLLPLIIDPEKATTFWLDAHYSGSDRSWQDPRYGECPLLAELKAIQTAKWRTRPYLCIDDAFIFRDAWEPVPGIFNPTFFTKLHWPLISEIRALLPEYDIREEDHILLCQPRD